MAEVTYTTVVWTAGDIITEAKMDNMVANDRAVDAMAQGIELLERADPTTPGTNKLHLYAKDKNGTPTVYVHNADGTVYELAEVTPTYIFPVAFPFVTAIAAPPIPVIKDSIITRAFAYSGTAPTGADLIFDINKNSSSLWGATPSNRLKIVASAQSGSQTSFDNVTLLRDDILTLDVDQVGSTIVGQNVVVSLKTK